MNAVLSGTPAWLTTRSTGCKAAERLSNVMIDSFGSLRWLLGLLLGILEAGRRNNVYSLEECMNRLTTMQVLVQVVETGSFSGAARQPANAPPSDKVAPPVDLQLDIYRRHPPRSL
jgi:hypothetical protein